MTGVVALGIVVRLIRWSGRWSDRLGQFVERGRDPQLRWSIGGELVMSAADVLDVLLGAMTGLRQGPLERADVRPRRTRR